MLCFTLIFKVIGQLTWYLILIRDNPGTSFCFTDSRNLHHALHWEKLKWLQSSQMFWKYHGSPTLRAPSVLRFLTLKEQLTLSHVYYITPWLKAFWRAFGDSWGAITQSLFKQQASVPTSSKLGITELDVRILSLFLVFFSFGEVRPLSLHLKSRHKSVLKNKPNWQRDNHTIQTSA